MKLVHKVSVFASLVLVQACAVDAGSHAAGADAGGVVSAELGTGVEDFEPLGDELVAIAGPQGGHHFIVHARMSGLDPGDPEQPGLRDNPATRFAAYLVTGSEEQQIDVEYPPLLLGYEDSGDGIYELPEGLLLILNESMLPAAYDQQIRITLEVTDRTGTVARDERSIMAVIDPLE